MASKPSDGLVDQLGKLYKDSQQEQQQSQQKPSRGRKVSSGGDKGIDVLNKQLTPEEREESARRAGQASGAVRQERGFVRKALLAKLTPEVLDQMLSAVLGQAIKKGDIAAYKAVLDTIGESNVQALQIDFGSDTRAAIANMSMQDKLALIQAVQNQSKGK